MGEAAQFGLRLTIGETGAMPEKGAIYPIPTNGDVVSDQGTAAGANGLLTRTWTARRGPAGSNENADAGFQIDLAEDLYAFLAAIKAYQSSAFRWTHVKIQPVGADGLTCTDESNLKVASSVYTFTTPQQGGQSSALPPQVSAAISLRATILGRRGRGRVYIPALSNDHLAAEGTWNATRSAAYRASFVTLVNALQNLPGTPDYVPIVAVTSGGNSTAVRPSEVRTGQRLDTIRSRREQVPEVYTATQL